MKLFENKKVLVVSLVSIAVMSLIFWKFVVNQGKSHSSSKKMYSHVSNNAQVQSNNLTVIDSKLKKSDVTTNVSPPIEKLNKKDKLQILKFAIVIDKFEKLDLIKTSELQYTQILSRGLTLFPKKDDIKKLRSEQVHTIPVPISLAGEYLGHLKTHLAKESKLLVPAMKFYSNCAVSIEILLSVKALCLANLVEYSKSHGKQVDYSLYEKQVIELAKYAEMTN
jgi:hypothetical protein